jgi:hypothetical protein
LHRSRANQVPKSRFLERGAGTSCSLDRPRRHGRVAKGAHKQEPPRGMALLTLGREGSPHGRFQLGITQPVRLEVSLSRTPTPRPAPRQRRHSYEDDHGAPRDKALERGRDAIHRHPDLLRRDGDEDLILLWRSPSASLPGN